MTKAASVYKKNSYLYVSASSAATSGVWIDASPNIKLALEESAAAKGQAVMMALAASQVRIPHPEATDGSVTAPLLKLANARSWAAFMKNAAFLRVEMDEDKIIMMPYENRGRKGGFVQLLDKTINLPCQASPVDIGSALDEALLLCE